MVLLILCFMLFYASYSKQLPEYFWHCFNIDLHLNAACDYFIFLCRLIFLV